MNQRESEMWAEGERRDRERAERERPIEEFEADVQRAQTALGIAEHRLRMARMRRA